MKKPFLFALAALSFSAVSAFAADITPATTSAPVPANVTPPTATSATPAASPATAYTKSHKNDRDWSLAEAREKAHKKIDRDQKYAAKLDKMTEADWAQHQKERHERKEKLSKMTPEERKAYWKEYRRKNSDDETNSSAEAATPVQN